MPNLKHFQLDSYGKKHHVKKISSLSHGLIIAWEVTSQKYGTLGPLLGWISTRSTFLLGEILDNLAKKKENTFFLECEPPVAIRKELYFYLQLDKWQNLAYFEFLTIRTNFSGSMWHPIPTEGTHFSQQVAAL